MCQTALPDRRQRFSRGGIQLGEHVQQRSNDIQMELEQGPVVSGNAAAQGLAQFGGLLGGVALCEVDADGFHDPCLASQSESASNPPVVLAKPHLVTLECS
jgi:hypothetical protein